MEPSRHVAAAGRRERDVAAERFGEDARRALPEREAQALAAVILACLQRDREVALEPPLKVLRLNCAPTSAERTSRISPECVSYSYRPSARI